MKKVYEQVGNSVKFTYIKTSAGVITVANEKETGYVGVAFLNPKDNFIKEVGRSVAVGRMNKKIKMGLAPELPPFAKHDDVETYIFDNIDSKEFPQRYRSSFSSKCW